MAEKNTQRIELFLRILYALAALLALFAILVQVGLIGGGTLMQWPTLQSRYGFCVLPGTGQFLF